MRQRRALLGFASLALFLLVPAAHGRAIASASLTVGPATASVGQTVHVVVHGLTATAAWPHVVQVHGSCPSWQAVSGRQPNAELQFPAKPVKGSFTWTIEWTLPFAPVRLCAYLVPAPHNPDAGGGTPVLKETPIRAVATLLVTPRVGFNDVVRDLVGVDPRTHSTFTALGSGLRIKQIIVKCGGSTPAQLLPRGYPGLWAFSQKRFLASLDVRLGWTLHFTARLTPENDANYDASPPPSRWTRPVFFSFTGKIGGPPLRFVGTGVLKGPGLPCPAVRRYR